RRQVVLAPGELAAPVEVVERLHAVAHHHDLVPEAVFREGLQRELGVALAVVGEEDAPHQVHAWPPAGLSVNRNVAPRPGAASAQMRPPWRARMRCTVARPMPVPSNWSARCSRWKTPKSLPAWAMSKPTPLSRTHTSTLPCASSLEPTSMRAGPRLRVYLTALPSRLDHTCFSIAASP